MCVYVRFGFSNPNEAFSTIYKLNVRSGSQTRTKHFRPSPNDQVATRVFSTSTNSCTCISENNFIFPFS